jgi:hypothetical protein
MLNQCEMCNQIQCVCGKPTYKELQAENKQLREKISELLVGNETVTIDYKG